MKHPNQIKLVPFAAIETRIHLIRGKRVTLDTDLAQLYGVATKNLNKAVERNRDRFPEDFMCQLTASEFADLRFQTGTSSRHGGRRYLPYAFTQEGIAMLSGVLRSPRAAAVNVELTRAFVRMRGMLLSVDELARKVEARDFEPRNTRNTRKGKGKDGFDRKEHREHKEKREYKPQMNGHGRRWGKHTDARGRISAHSDGAGAFWNGRKRFSNAVPFAHANAVSPLRLPPQSMTLCAVREPTELAERLGLRQSSGAL